MATVYTMTGLVYCGGECYPPQNWVALDVKLYDGWAKCEDEIWLYFPDGGKLESVARDAGPLHKYYIADYPEKRLLADVPAHLWPYTGKTNPHPITSSPVRIVNFSETKRQFLSHVGP